MCRHRACAVEQAGTGWDFAVHSRQRLQQAQQQHRKGAADLKLARAQEGSLQLLLLCLHAARWSQMLAECWIL